MKIIIFTDGASRGNPGPASYGFAISDEKGKSIHQEGKYIGIATNNVAEYTAVLEALNYVKEKLGKDDWTIEFKADSKLVAEQLSGRYKVKAEHLKPIIEQIRVLIADLGQKVSFSHIPRAKNWQADKIANQALDKRLN